MGLLGGAISLGTDIVTGEFQENMGSSIAHAAAVTAGSIVGGVFGPVGAMVGGALADLAVSGVEKLIGNARAVIDNPFHRNGLFGVCSKFKWKKFIFAFILIPFFSCVAYHFIGFAVYCSANCLLTSFEGFFNVGC